MDLDRHSKLFLKGYNEQDKAKKPSDVGMTSTDRSKRKLSRLETDGF